MGTHPIFESDFDCLTDMETDRDQSSSHVQQELLSRPERRQLQKQQVEADLRHNLPSHFFPDDQWVYAADKKEPGAISDEIRKNWVWYRIGAEEFEPLNQCDGASTSNKEAFEEEYQ